MDPNQARGRTIPTVQVDANETKNERVFWFIVWDSSIHGATQDSAVKPSNTHNALGCRYGFTVESYVLQGNSGASAN